MSFLYPAFLFALFALLIPVIIHLFNFRTYKTVYFSNVAFLKNVKKETESKSNLKHIIVLLLRILTISSLVFAFSSPYIPEKNTSSGKNNFIVIYVDNSFSTNAESKFGKIIEFEKKKALETADAYPEDAKILYLTNDFELKHQHPVSKEQFKDFVLQTQTSASVKTISEIYDKAKDIISENFDNDKNITYYFISDFQKNISDFDGLKPDSLQKFVFIPVLPEKTNNLYIDSVWFETPNRLVNREDKIFVKIKNLSGEDYEKMPLKLYLNDKQIATSSFSVKANDETTGIINFINKKHGITKGKIEISDFPITYDNTFYFSFNLTDKVKVLNIYDSGEPSKYIKNVFSKVSFVEFTDVLSSSLNKNNFSDYNVIICDGLKKIPPSLNEKLTDFTLSGGILLIFPKINCNTESYNKLFNNLNTNYITRYDTSEIYADKINYDNEILKDVFKKREKNTDMPVVFKRLIFGDMTKVNENVILYTEKNDKLIFGYTAEKGKIFIFSSYPSPDYGNLIYHPLWVSILYNAVLYNSAGKNIFYTIGNNNVVNLKCGKKNEDKVINIVNEEYKTNFIPRILNINESECKIFPDDNIKKAGHYKVYSGSDLTGIISYNYNRKESDLSHYSYKDLKKMSKSYDKLNISILNSENNNFKESITAEKQGTKLYKYFLIAALIFLLSEILVIKYL